MRKFAAIIFCFIIASGGSFLLFLLFSGRIQLTETQREWEKHLEEKSPANSAARKILRRFDFLSSEVTTGSNGVLFWQPELSAAAATSRLPEAVAGIGTISSGLCGKKGLLILPIPLRGWFLRENLPLPVWRELPAHADGRVLAAALPAGTVLPLEDLFEELSSSGTPVYLHRDNHWTAAAMKAAAELAGEHLGLRRRTDTAFQKITLAGMGNLAVMVGASAERAEIFLPSYSGEEETGDAPEILLCGDSFFNIYSLASSGFGAGAGFPEMLEALFCCRVTSVSIDGGGEGAARSMLPRLGINPEDFDFVIWEFPVYEIQRSSWQNSTAVKIPQHQLINIAGGRVITLEIKAAASAPSPGSVNRLYRNLLAEFIAVDAQGTEYLLCLPALIDGREMPLPITGDTVRAEILTQQQGANVYSTMARESVDCGGDFVLRPLIYGENVQILHKAPRR